MANMTPMMRQYLEMKDKITGEVEQSGGCTGNCASCGGCH